MWPLFILFLDKNPLTARTDPPPLSLPKMQSTFQCTNILYSKLCIKFRKERKCFLRTRQMCFKICYPIKFFRGNSSSPIEVYFKLFCIMTVIIGEYASALDENWTLRQCFLTQSEILQGNLTNFNKKTHKTNFPYFLKKLHQKSVFNET